ncbi:hypothetical protein BJ742DRAFT_744732 [Cladochytrium replicatum]|nr:hypothetical protein BJ742DRAFT_744732 [Cladochytrium replicatum]
MPYSSAVFLLRMAAAGSNMVVVAGVYRAACGVSWVRGSGRWIGEQALRELHMEAGSHRVGWKAELITEDLLRQVKDWSRRWGGGKFRSQQQRLWTTQQHYWCTPEGLEVLGGLWHEFCKFWGYGQMTQRSLW